MRIVLASASPRRKQLLKQMGIEFDIITSHIEEKVPKDVAIEEIPVELAYSKARDVASRVKGSAIVIGADTIVMKDEILGKPRDEDDARRMLIKLQGQTHQVITGLALINPYTGQIQKGYEKTLVRMASLTIEEIDHYVRTGEPMDKAGAYGIQGWAGIFIPEINGCYYNVMGLPIHRLWEMLKKFDASLLNCIKA